MERCRVEVERRGYSVHVILHQRGASDSGQTFHTSGIKIYKEHMQFIHAKA